MGSNVYGWFNRSRCELEFPFSVFALPRVYTRKPLILRSSRVISAGCSQGSWNGPVLSLRRIPKLETVPLSTFASDTSPAPVSRRRKRPARAFAATYMHAEASIHARLWAAPFRTAPLPRQFPRVVPFSTRPFEFRVVPPATRRTGL